MHIYTFKENKSNELETISTKVIILLVPTH